MPKKNDEEQVESEINIPEIDKDTVLKSVKLNDAEPKVKKSKPATKTISVKDQTKELYEEFGEFMKVKADMVVDVGLKQVIPTPIDILNAILGGGFAVGALSIIVGNPGSGKSMLAIQTMGSGQLKYKNFLATFMDSEEATSTLRLANLGVKNPMIKPYVDITVEKVFKHLEAMCLFKEQKKMNDNPSICVWDSIANTLSEKEREAEDVNSVIGYKARMLSLLVPKYVARCSQHNIAWLAVNQLRDQLAIGNFAPAKDLKFMTMGKSMPGGNVLKYNAFSLLEMKHKGIIDPDKMGFDGIISTIKTVKCKLFPPNIEIELVGDFIRGYSNFWTNYSFLVKEGRLSSGAWNFLKTLPEKKFRTKDAEALYNENGEFTKKYDEAVTECINTEIIEKYNPVI